MAERYDAIVVGAGHNGLVCASYLAKHGLSVCVLERRHIIGGAAATEELWPGYKVSSASYVMGLLQPKIILDLKLKQFGFEVLPPPPPYHPLSNGDRVFFWEDEQRVAQEFSRFHPKDGEAFIRYRSHLRKVAPFMHKLLWEVPPDPGSKRFGDGVGLAKFAWRFRKIGNQFYEIFDLLTMSAHEYLSRWFKSDEAKTVIGFYAGCAGGHFTSPNTPGTAFVLIRPLLRPGNTEAGMWGFMRGGMGSISTAIAKSAESLGVKIRTNSEVTSITTRNGKATGVTLTCGEEILSKIVISNASARTTFTKLLSPSDLPSDFLIGIENIRSESSSFKMNLALDGLPKFKNFDAGEAGFGYPAQIRIGPSIDYLERAFTDVRTHHFSPNPAMLICVPSVVDSSLAPAGRYVVNIFGNHSPYTLRDSNWNEQRPNLFKAAINAVELFAPGFKNHIVHEETLTPLDLEQRFDLPRGHIHHMELTADQIFFKRPVPHYADYRSPIDGLYQCGASTHPGGGVTGVPGHNAAAVILKDRL
ncbi:MAG: phytoene desaturase family protein [Alphaproteobacteria bacterium]